MSTTTLDFYWKLASLDENERLDAATNLINALCKFQSELPATEDKLAETESDLDQLCASDVAYALKRLIKGLASSRDGARQGYSIALSELLARVPCISVKLVLDLLWKYTTATKSMKGQEQRDMRFGRIFGLMALLQSGILAERKQSVGLADIRRIVGELATIGAKKSYLREISYVTLASMVPVLGGFEFDQDLVALFVGVALGKGRIETPDELYLALRLRQYYPEYDWHSALPKWHGKHMLAQKNLGKLVSILCEISEENPELFSSWHPQLHIVWDEVFDLYFNQDRQEEREKRQVMEFSLLWDAVVERGLFAPGSSQFRRYWGFLLLERMMPYMSETTVPTLMSPNVVRALSDNVSLTSKSPLVKVGIQTVEKLVVACEQNSKIGLVVLTHLLNQKNTIPPAGTKKTSLRSMMASRIVSKLDAEDIRGYVKYLQNIFMAPSQAATGEDVMEGVATPMHGKNVSGKSIEKQRFWAIEQMIRVARFDQLPTSNELTTEVLNFVTAHATFENHDQKKPGTKNVPELEIVANPPLSFTTRSYCAGALINVVGELNRSTGGGSVPGEGQHQGTRQLLAGGPNEGSLWVTQVIDKVVTGTAAPARKLGVVLHGFDQSKPMLSDMRKLLHRLEKKFTKPSAQSLRYRMMGLLLGNIAIMATFLQNPHMREEYLELVPELVECCEKMLDSKKATKAEDEPEPVEVLTDILISLLAKDSNSLRKLCEQVFGPFAELMTATAIDAITSVLLAKEGQAGDGEDGEAAVETHTEPVDQMDVVDEEEGEGEDDDEEEQLQMGEVDEELRQKIREALGGGDTDAAVEREEEEEDFDDEQMKVFDDKLAEIFHHKKQQKAAVRDLKITFVNFKLRVLDLVDVFMAKQPTNPLVLKILPALVELGKMTSKDSRSKAIHDRCMNILGAKRSGFPTGFEKKEGVEVLTFMHEKARRVAERTELRQLGQAVAAMTRSLLSDFPDEESSSQVYDQMWMTVKDSMARQASQIHADFFKPACDKLLPNQLELLWRLGAQALKEFGHPQQALNVFRQVQAYGLAGMVASTAGRLEESGHGLVGEMLREWQAAMRATMVYAASTERNRHPKSDKLMLDNQRLREIMEESLSLVGKCVKADGKIAESLVNGQEWQAAVRTLSESENFNSPVVKRLCEKLADL